MFRYEDPFPSGSSIAKLISNCKPIPLKWALNDNGDVTFYSFDEMDIPVMN